MFQDANKSKKDLRHVRNKARRRAAQAENEPPSSHADHAEPSSPSVPPLHPARSGFNDALGSHPNTAGKSFEVNALQALFDAMGWCSASSSICVAVC